MDSAPPSLQQYEQQLYSVFKTFDVDNSEALSRSAVLALCDALQLEQRGAALADTLFQRRDQRVTFAQFRGGLLAVLGAGDDAAPTQPSAPHSDDDSGREVAPKFVFGSKKYGRRSRPPRAASAPASPERDPAAAGRARSASAAGCRAAAPELAHERRVDCAGALALCRRLRMDNIDRRLVERIFEDAPAAETTVGEFFHRLNSSLSTSIADTCVAAAPGEPVAAGAPGDLPSELVVQAWQDAGVPAPRSLLYELGCDGATLRASDLELALDAELHALGAPTEERAPALLVAALALSRVRRQRAQQHADEACGERERLRAEVGEANRRARLLAQEVDERHARLEADAAAGMRRAEARQADAARALLAERAAEREQAAGERAALEAEATRRADGEARARTEAAALRTRVQELEARAVAAEGRAAGSERERARLAGELRSARAAPPPAPPSPGAAAAELQARVVELARDNKAVRDRCDELCAALEAAQSGAGRGGPAGGGAGGASWREEAGTEEPDLVSEPFDHSEECESSLSSAELSPGARAPLGSARGLRAALLATPPCALCAPLAAAAARLADALLAPDAPACAHSAAQTDLTPHAEDAAADALRTQLADTEQRHEHEKQKLNDLIKELEASLEALREEYERCEEYWAGKVRDERALQAAEQLAGDARLAELARRIHEYEVQFAGAAPPPPPRLPAIAECAALEAQVGALEREHAQHRRDAQRELDAAGRRAERLADTVRALKEQLSRQARERAAPEPGWPAWAREAGALRARLARADAAVARLTARLAAADILVKELYVENCLLPLSPRARRL